MLFFIWILISIFLVFFSTENFWKNILAFTRITLCCGEFLLIYLQGQAKKGSKVEWGKLRQGRLALHRLAILSSRIEVGISNRRSIFLTSLYFGDHLWKIYPHQHETFLPNVTILRSQLWQAVTILTTHEDYEQLGSTATTVTMCDHLGPHVTAWYVCLKLWMTADPLDGFHLV